ncbi:MAG TPA: acyltransferase [Polyangiaceae bacterium]|nr:acyltransferase [Polyangiaceae bacterium]
MAVDYLRAPPRHRLDPHRHVVTAWCMPLPLAPLGVSGVHSQVAIGIVASASTMVERASRIGWIDVLRGWAVLSVILLHLNIRVPFAASRIGAGLPGPIIKAVFWSGYHGVIVFFVISGFLITTMALERWRALDHIPLREFYVRRFARILPCLLLFVVVQSALQLALGEPFSSQTSPTSLPRTVLAALTFHLNWLEARDGYLPGAWDVLWSLSIEEAFYAFFPILCVLIRWPSALVVALGGFVLAGPFARSSSAANEIWADHGYFSCMGEIALGCLTALYAARVRTSPERARLLAMGGAGLMVFVIFFRRALFDWGISPRGLHVNLLALGTALVILSVHSRPDWNVSSGGAGLRGLRRLGRISYEVYLSHLFVILPAVVVFEALGSPKSAIVPFDLLNLVATGLVGAWLAKYFSEPLNRRLRAALLLPESQRSDRQLLDE